MGRTFIIARTTYSFITRQGLYYLVLITLAVMIYMLKHLTLFSFSQEANSIREMGIATFSLWGLIIVVIMAGPIITQELEDKTAVTILTKPIRRSDFLLGKFFGTLGAILVGQIFLTAVLIYTLWSYISFDLLQGAAFRDVTGHEKATVYEFLYGAFIEKNVVLVAEGSLLGFLQISIISAICIACAAFFPVVVTVSTTMLIYIIGNLSAYMKASIHKIGFLPLDLIANFIYYAFPNLGYFNLQAAFSEGRMISVTYMASVFIYTAAYVTIVTMLATMLFERREIK
ncbi:hypothetical protein HY605_05180 [Candidatus Peregrinibacteria bacterium]|nr:hypothetical protein [Candidatus Peregrinibacteria bacterium]